MDAAEVYLAKPAPDDIERVLREPLKATVGTVNPDGSIHLAFVIFLWEDGKFYFETASMTRKAKNIAERPTASFAFEGRGFMAMAEGVGRLIRGEDANAINDRIRKHHLTAEAADTVGAAWGTVDDVCIEITPRKWRSWSSEKLTELGERHSEGLPKDRWFT